MAAALFCLLRDFDNGFYDVPSDRSGFFDVRFRFSLCTTFFLQSRPQAVLLVEIGLRPGKSNAA
jgi:hypothetical protein